MGLKRNMGWKSPVDFTTYRSSNMVKKAAVTALLASSFTFNIGFAKDSEDGILQEIYHVYAGNEYVGAISDEEAVDEIIDAKREEMSNQFTELTFTDDANVKIVPEQVFDATTNDAQTLTNLSDSIEVNASAFGLAVNDEMAVYVKDREAYDNVIKQLKLSAVSEKELNELEVRKQSQESLPPLKENETRIIDVLLSEKISGVTQSVKPEEVMSVEDAVTFLKKGTLEEKTYNVQAGDVFGSIASKFNLSSDQLSDLNPGITADSVLQIGQALKVTALKPLVNVQVIKEKKVHEKVAAQKQVEESDAMLKGETKVKQEGVDGVNEMTYTIREMNGQRVGKSLKEEKVLKEVKNEIIVKGTKVIPNLGTGTYVWPTQGGYVSSGMGARWGRTHRGTDIARPSGNAIFAIDNGTVTFAGWDGTYGNKIVVNHNNGMTSTYAHLSKINVSIGQTVGQGQTIGVMGSTGRSTGKHLHIEMTRNGALVNALSYIR